MLSHGALVVATPAKSLSLLSSRSTFPSSISSMRNLRTLSDAGDSVCPRRRNLITFSAKNEHRFKEAIQTEYIFKSELTRFSVEEGIPLKNLVDFVDWCKNLWKASSMEGCYFWPSEPSTINPQSHPEQWRYSSWVRDPSLFLPNTFLVLAKIIFAVKEI